MELYIHQPQEKVTYQKMSKNTKKFIRTVRGKDLLEDLTFGRNGWDVIYKFDVWTHRERLGACGYAKACQMNHQYPEIVVKWDKVKEEDLAEGHPQKGKLHRELRQALMGAKLQMPKEIAKYDEIRLNPEWHDLVPKKFRYFRGLHISIEQKADMSHLEKGWGLRELCQFYNADISIYEDFINHFQLWDVWDNNGNVGVIDGKPVILDYAL